jgi:amidase
MPVATFISRLDQPGSGPRIAVKDVIDIAGVPTTAGCKAVAATAAPAARDAACMAGARAADAVIVGKANMHELAFGSSGVNPWFGTPVNPLDPALLPGGSSSGSAVAVAEGSADIGYGTDTGCSVRVPAAFCGLAGLKTTFGRISRDGVFPLAPSLDTVGPIAADVEGLTAAMALLEPGFAVTQSPATRIGRLRPPSDELDPRVDAAVDAALKASGLETVEVDAVGWADALTQAYLLTAAEAAALHSRLMAARDGISDPVRALLEFGAGVTADQLSAARAYQLGWKALLARILGHVDVIALPTVPFFPPPLAEAEQHGFPQFAAPVNLAGLPAVALPVPSTHRLPASIQLIGPANGEELLLATAALVESAVGHHR